MKKLGLADIRARLEDMADIRAHLSLAIDEAFDALKALEADTEGPAQVKLAHVKTGEKFSFAGMEWVKLDGADGVTLCLAAECVCNKAFDEDNCNDWRSSSLRKWLNGDFHEKLCDEMPANCTVFEPFHKIVSNLTADDGMKDYGTAEDTIALLSCDLYRKYRDIIPALEDEWYWTLTPWSCLEDYSGHVRYVNSPGTLNNNNAYYGNGGVRPLCNLDSEILVSTL